MMPVTAYAVPEKTFKAVLDSDNVLHFYYDDSSHSGEGTLYTNLPTNAVKRDDWGNEYNVKRSLVKSVVIDASVMNYKGLKSTAYMFSEMLNADSIIGAEYLDVSQVEDMSYMFKEFGGSTTISTVPNVKEWSTSKVKNMTSLFQRFGYSSDQLTDVPDVSCWDVSSLTNASNMFYWYGKKVLNVPQVGAWGKNTSNLQNVEGMFRNYANSSSQIDIVPDVSTWDTSNILDASYMFTGYAASSEVLNVVPDISGWKTDNLTTVEMMFYNYGKNSTKLNAVPDISGWNVLKLTNVVSFMAGYGQASEEIEFVLDLSQWNMPAYDNGSFFNNNTALKAKKWVVIIPEKTDEAPNEVENTTTAWYVGPSGARKTLTPPENRVFSIYKSIVNEIPVADKDTNNGYIDVPAKSLPGETVTLTVNPNTGYQLKADTLEASYNNGASQTLTLTQDTTDETKYTFTMPGYEVTVTAEFEEKPSEIKVTASLEKTTYLVGESVFVKGTVMDGNNPVANATVNFVANGELISRATTSDGCCQVHFDSLPAGSYVIKVSYEKDGDEYKDEVIVTVKEQNPEPDIKFTASSDKSVYDEGELITLTATVMDGNTPVDKELVVFSVNGRTITVQTINGSCSISTSLPAGTYTISACYEKDGDQYKDEVEVTVMKQPNENYIVKFDLNNGNTNGPEMQTIEEGKKATKPENPTYEGFVFAEWYTDKDCTDGNEYDFDSEVNEDFVLYAKWISKLPENHLVVFDTNGHDEIDAQKIKHGEKATKPADPSDEGWIFEGWYSDAELTKEYDFSAPIMADIKLFAKWTEAGLPTPPEPKPVEVYYAPLVADLKANEEGVIEWKAGDSLPLEAVKLLVDKPELSLEFTFTYEGEEHTIFIPAGAFEKYYDVTIPWYGPAWLIQYFEKSEKEVIEYTIVSGDTLNALAEKFKCTVEEILALNPYISDKHWIYPNNKLLIPVQK